VIDYGGSKRSREAKNKGGKWTGQLPPSLPTYVHYCMSCVLPGFPLNENEHGMVTGGMVFWQHAWKTLQAASLDNDGGEWLATSHVAWELFSNKYSITYIFIVRPYHRLLRHRGSTEIYTTYIKITKHTELKWLKANTLLKNCPHHILDHILTAGLLCTQTILWRYTQHFTSHTKSTQLYIVIVKRKE